MYAHPVPFLYKKRWFNGPKGFCLNHPFQKHSERGKLRHEIMEIFINQVFLTFRKPFSVSNIIFVHGKEADGLLLHNIGG
jgi:hypothetical protein